MADINNNQDLNAEIELHNEIDSWGDELTSYYYTAVMTVLKTGDLKALAEYFKKFSTQLMQKGIDVPSLINEQTLKNLAKVNENAIIEAKKEKVKESKRSKVKNFTIIALIGVTIFVLFKNKQNQ
jgi:folylpolyglutamate synthase/dihydropteroate synthase